MNHFVFRTSNYLRKIVLASLFAILLCTAGGLSPVAAQGKQLSLADILIALRSKKAEIDEKNRLLSEAVKTRGITFTLTPEIEKELTSTGAYNDLLDAIRSRSSIETVAARRPDPVTRSSVQSSPPTLDFSFYRNRANNEIVNNEIEQAITDLGKALELKPADAGTYLARALAYIKQEKHESSLADLDKVIEIDKKNSTAYYIRGQVFEKLGKYENAFSDFKAATEIDPANSEASAAVTRVHAVLDAASAKPAQPKSPPTTPAGPTTLTLGSINEFAVRLEKPVYTPTDRKLGYRGVVTVFVTLDEEGKVVSAVAIDGPQQLRSVSEAAVRRSKFKPATSNGHAVRATGYISFNFVAN